MTYDDAAFHTDVFRKIETRLAVFSPEIKLRDHIVKNYQPRNKDDHYLISNPLTLQGVDFVVENLDLLEQAINEAKTGTDKAFAEGSSKPSDWKQHWALAASMMATKGTGYREPWRFYLNERGLRIREAQPPQLHAPQMDAAFAGYFGESNTLNLSALHISISPIKKDGRTNWWCNIHVDETGVAMMDAKNNLSISPNFISHTFNELLLKTIIGEHLPTWFVDRVNLHVLSPETNYRRVGVSVDVLKGENYKLTVTASCGLTTCTDIDVNKIIRLDLDALKQLNPTVNYVHRF